jgi:hypothetical protein
LSHGSNYGSEIFASVAADLANLLTILNRDGFFLTSGCGCAAGATFGSSASIDDLIRDSKEAAKLSNAAKSAATSVVAFLVVAFFSVGCGSGVTFSTFSGSGSGSGVGSVGFGCSGSGSGVSTFSTFAGVGAGAAFPPFTTCHPGTISQIPQPSVVNIDPSPSLGMTDG